ncbi:flagellar hook-basal body complex protein FliE, partial [Treponema pallidum]
VDPESVDVHDVTVAMAEASMSLKIAQTVIDKVLKSWNDVTTAR